MEKKDRYWLSLWLGLALFFVIMILGIFYWDYIKDTRMAELGYQRVTLLGNNYPEWQKVGSVNR